jgi:acetolactate synthase-1/2/3 large subunit
MDSIPVVVLTGQVPTSLIGNDAFQEVDIVGITRPCTKHNYLVKNAEDLNRILREAFFIARSGRPGPVLVDLPKDLFKATLQHKPLNEVSLKSYNPTYEPNPRQLPKALDLIMEAERPVVFSGGGVILSKASKELREFVKKIHAPITSSLMGLGAYPGTDPLWLGMIGMHGTYCANMSSAECDLLIAIGVRFDDRVTGKISAFAPKAKIIHIDIDPTSIRKNLPVTVPIVGDCRITLQRLNALLKNEKLASIKKKRTPWLEQIQKWRAANPLSYVQGETIKPQFVVEKIYEMSKGKAIITTEVGQNQMWTAQYYHFEQPNTFITSGGLGCMGFGLPAAIGAQIARPDKLVIDIAGDGSIQMNIQEMARRSSTTFP